MWKVNAWGGTWARALGVPQSIFATYAVPVYILLSEGRDGFIVLWYDGLLVFAPHSSLRDQWLARVPRNRTLLGVTWKYLQTRHHVFEFVGIRWESHPGGPCFQHGPHVLQSVQHALSITPRHVACITGLFVRPTAQSPVAHSPPLASVFSGSHT
jgi:hypothetical protein